MLKSCESPKVNVCSKSFKFMSMLGGPWSIKEKILAFIDTAMFIS